jgi:cellulose biosynthesis protein BcsQ
MTAEQTNRRGNVYTFYSYKGGTGRSMAVANVAAMLAKWGRSVLVVDWDLEAPGLERFFVDAKEVPAAEAKLGVVDLIEAHACQKSLEWRECVLNLKLKKTAAPISLISAGRRGSDYIDRMQKLDFPFLFEKKNLGRYIEDLRSSWISNFEFVLIDSRTGVTDVGGICTVHLADILVLLFTSTESSVEGSLEIAKRARAARQSLPLDREELLVIPIPARDESRTEYELAARWKKRFSVEFEKFYADWLPSKGLIQQAVEMLSIPYVPYWSFGERLPALEESTNDPAGLAAAYDLLARLLVSRLDWNEALEGHSLRPAPRLEQRHLDDKWAASHRATALTGLNKVSKTGFVELYHCCVDFPISRKQNELLEVARQAMIRTFGWPIGVVLDREDARPRPMNEGIAAEIATTGFSGGEMYDYWILTHNGDFYSLMSLFEDDRAEASIFFDTQIIRTSEALLHCANLYRALGVSAKAEIEFRLSHGGLRGRKLRSAGRTMPSLAEHVNKYEDEVSETIRFRLDQIDTELTQLVIKLCSPLFMLFDFFAPTQEAYEGRIKNFVAGRIS